MKWTIEKQYDGMLVREYLHSVRAFSRRMVKTVKFEGSIMLNGKPVTVRSTLHKGDELAITFPEERKEDGLTPIEISLDIIFEDEEILVLNKPAGIPVVPSPHFQGGSIASGLISYYQKKNLNYTAHIVTRLDKDTSGLMLVAKHRFSHSQLARLQQQGKVNRSYTALVDGQLEAKKGVIDVPIGRKSTSIIEREVREDGQKAVTHYEVIEELERFSVVHVRLETGRTHQIRVHFASLGHPLLGDDLYGGPMKEGIKRQALHCHELSFYHPFRGETVELVTPVLKDMRLLMEQ
ncbi:RluA family pseudouridine synthase [Salinibacillus xinjiangensis]|uniref:Pseudouridine synthase n=1 Tax=Salinibacillus xinjiangensis TaxID=1229268 RepID=A0A6G1X7W3_9BACI|nr:RluA family pseudouridine synthase [Salinibacillus xinjiangensis]MRG87093.1 RluA family pseudouridine synthase [Salinibacillus xinjiangensis]